MAAATAAVRPSYTYVTFIHIKGIGLNIEPTAAGAAEPTDARAWTQILMRYREPSAARSLVELAVTLLRWRCSGR